MKSLSKRTGFFWSVERCFGFANGVFWGNLECFDFVKEYAEYHINFYGGKTDVTSSRWRLYSVCV